MKALGKILKNSDSLETVNSLLKTNNSVVIDNLKRLIKESPNLDPNLLNEFLSKPDLVTKLFSSCNMDPALMNRILAKESKTDLNLFENVIMKTPT